MTMLIFQQRRWRMIKVYQINIPCTGIDYNPITLMCGDAVFGLRPIL
jgi:hypothetical protein